MPSSFTEKIKEGISFEDFTLRCARNFGALVTMRDESLNAPLPDEIKPDTRYYDKELRRLRAEFKNLQQMNPAQAARLYRRKHENSIKEEESRKIEQLTLKNQYLEMLIKVISWNAPTPEHEGLKKFMVKQIRDSIEGDCTIREIEPYPKKTPKQLYAEKMASVESDIHFYVKKRREEVERSKEHTKWIKDLKQSL